jgi:SAM-dependent methyltransferase
MPFLHTRCRRPEVMDQPDLEPARHDRALAGLARLNFFSGSTRILWPALARLGRTAGQLRILDIACGAGDLPVRLWRRARKAGLDWQVEGCDLSPTAVEHAQRRARGAGADVHFFVHDALANPLPGRPDAVTCSLFLHHLDDEQAAHLLRRLAGLDGGAAPRLVLVNDLARGLSGLALAHLAARLLTRSNVVHVDAPRSVEAAFTPDEVRRLAERAGLHGATVVRRWPCRWLLTWQP